MTLPAGTVTFLLTDVEGSTRLWERDHAAMAAAMARHDEVAHRTVADHGGVLVTDQGEGDSVFAVFARAADAAACALALQRALCAEEWPDGAVVRVRMAIHSGEAEMREGNYYGVTVGRCARIRSLAHGGQVLLSQAAFELARDSLPEDSSVRDLGSHRLRDLSRPEEIFQLCHPELPGEFAPPRSLDALPHNLPVQLTSFIGREEEMREVRKLLATSRLLTLTGAGGCGKTRLALQVAADIVDDFPDGVWLVDLAPITDPALVPGQVAGTLGVIEEPGRPLMDTMVAFLRPRRLMLLLDNCEHLVDACASLTTTLLRGCADLQVVVTTREPLGVSGEVAWRVPSLSMPDPADLPAPEGLGSYEAIRLFLERASAAEPSFAITRSNAAAVVQVCRRLDGIPLGIELAAARVKVLTPDQIAARLDDRFRLLTVGSRTALARQQTLRAAVDWSYDLLSEPEKVLLRRLSAFAGGFTLEAAEAVCSGGAVGQFDVLDLVSHLVDKSLVVSDAPGGGTRYRLLETIRQYGREKLLDSGEGPEFRRRHADWFLAMAEALGPEVEGPDPTAVLDLIEVEHDNLRAAVEWRAEDPGGAVAVLRAAAEIRRYWEIRGSIGEGRAWLERGLAEEGLPPELRAKALNAAGVLAILHADIAAAEAWLGEALRIRRELGQPAGISQAINNYTLLLDERERKRELYTEAVEMARMAGEIEAEIVALGNLASVTAPGGDMAGALRLLEEAISLSREHGYRRRLRENLTGLGWYALVRAEYSRARSHFDEALEVALALRERAGIAQSQVGLGWIAIVDGDLATARSLFEQTLTLARDEGVKWGVVGGLVNVGVLATVEGDLQRAERVLREAVEMVRRIDPRFGDNAIAALGRVRRQLGDLVEAELLARQSLHLRLAEGDVFSVAGSLEELGVIASAAGDARRAVRLMGIARSLFSRMGTQWLPFMQEELDARFDEARRALGEEEADAILAEAAGADVEAVAREIMAEP